MKKRLFTILLSVLMTLSLFGCSTTEEQVNNTIKVIYDCDPYFFNDDSLTMSLLVEADNQELIDLLGITITGGNKFIAESTNTALWNLEQLDRTDIGVYQGVDIPLDGISDFSGIEINVKFGSLFNFDNYIEPSKYHDLGDYYNEKYGYSKTNAQELSAIDYLVNTVKENPNEVTIIATGAMTNIALAIEKDPDFAKNVKEIVYMAGDFSNTGNVTQYAEYNAIYDPAALKICLDADFPKQTIVSNEISTTLTVDFCVYDELLKKAENHGTLTSKFWIDYFEELYSESVLGKNYAWDQACVAVLLYPDCISRSRDNTKINVVTEMNNEYGRTTFEPNGGNITLSRGLKNNMYWDYFTSLWTNNYEDVISYEEIEKEFILNSSQLFPTSLEELYSYSDDQLKRIYSLSIIGDTVYCNDINDDKNDTIICNVEPFPKGNFADYVIIRDAPDKSSLKNKQINKRGPLKDLSLISKMTNLQQLSIIFNDLESLEGLEKLKQLKKICFNNFSSAHSLKLPSEFFEKDVEYLGDYIINIEIESLELLKNIKMFEFAGQLKLQGICMGSMSLPDNLNYKNVYISGKHFDISIAP